MYNHLIVRKMKKIGIILSGILLTCNAGLANNIQYTAVLKANPLPVFTPKELSIAVIVLAVLLTGLSLYVFLVLNNKTRFRNNILKELENCKENGRMESYQQSIIDKVFEQSKQFLTDNFSKLDDKEVSAIAIEDLQKRVEALEDSGRSSSTPEESAIPIQSQSQQSHSLYADSIYDGKFEHVRETPDDDTVFELKLKQAGDTRADVVVYREAYRTVIADSVFLEGCETQVVGKKNTVTMQCDGVASRDDSGNWIISKKPKVLIS
jgi:hypothetical protein